MSKIQKIICLVCVLAGLVIAIVGGIYVCCVHWDANIYMFAEIAECESLRALNNTEGKFTEYDTALDKHLGNLSYLSAFSGKYTCDKFSFEIFSYTFADEEAAKIYFEKATGKNNDNRDTNFSLASGILSSRIVVFSGNRAYAVKCSTMDLHAVLQMLEDQFTVKIAGK